MHLFRKIVALCTIITMLHVPILPESVSATADPFAPCRPEIVQKIYQMLKDVRDFFVLHDITYWVDSGTLLGAVRHRGLIPWDDDLDLCIFERDEQKFLSLFPILEHAGYHVIKMAYGYKIYHNTGIPIANRPFLHPGCDIFIMKTNGEKAFYKIRFPKELRDNLELEMKDIVPLRDYVFGPLVVSGPRNPFPYLKHWYGDDYLTVAHKEFDHEHDVLITPTTKVLTEKDYAPARPSAPLENRIVPFAPQQWVPFGSIPQPQQ